MNASRPTSDALLEVVGIDKTFVTKQHHRRVLTHAASNLALTVATGDAFGIVGESGSGKSTLANMIMGLERPDSGEIRFRGRTISSGRKAFPHGDIQIVFQDPQSSLDPRMSIRELLREPLVPLGHDERRKCGAPDQLEAMMRHVGLLPQHLDRRSHEFSGGQRQRIAIARALMTSPRLLVLDEPTSALDVSVQATILNLLRQLKIEYGLSYLFISHNLAVVRHLCNKVAVMQAGRIVEQGPTARVFDAPQHIYTRTLLSATPTLRPVGQP